MMEGVEATVSKYHPMATTPAMAVMDLEYADGAVLIARSAEIANTLMKAAEEEALRYGLKLNKATTCRLSYNSQAPVICWQRRTGTKGPRGPAPRNYYG